MTAQMGRGWQSGDHRFTFRDDESLAGNEERFRRTFTHAPLAQTIVTLDGEFVVTNDRWQEHLGYDASELLGMHMWQVTHPDDWEISADAITAVLSGQTDSVTIDKRYLRRDGDVLFARTSIAVIKGDDGEPRYLNAIIENVTEQTRDRALLAAETAFYDAAADDKPEKDLVSVLVATVEQLIPDCRAAGLLLDDDKVTLRLVAPGSLPDPLREAIVAVPMTADGTPCGRAAVTREMVFVPDLASDPGAAQWAPLLAANGIVSCWSVPILTPDGTVLGTFAVYRGIGHRPLDEHVALATRLAKFAGLAITRRREHNTLGRDPDLDMPNRGGLLSRLASRQEQGGRQAAYVVELLGFSDVITGLGRTIGIGVLRAARNRLTGHLVAEDALAALGAARFGILCDAAMAGPDFIERLLIAFEEPLVVEGFPFHLGIRVGASEGAIATDRLLEEAEIALAHARETGENVLRFHPGMEAPYMQRLAFARTFREALDAGALYLHVQPKFTCAERRLTGVECLVRWRTEDGREQSPAEFVALAEQTGLMRRLTRFVLHAAAQQWREWQAVGIDTSIAVNVSATDIGDPRFEETLREALDSAAMPSDRLQIEITEDAVMAHPDKVVGLLRRLREAGVTIAIDDFGVGQSSLAYLRNFPIDELKIDRSFILGVEDDASRESIVASIVGLARALGVRCVAEGVETEAALAVLTALGCDEVQGYHLARPGPPAELVARFSR